MESNFSIWPIISSLCSKSDQQIPNKNTILLKLFGSRLGSGPGPGPWSQLLGAYGPFGAQHGPDVSTHVLCSILLVFLLFFILCVSLVFRFLGLGWAWGDPLDPPHLYLLKDGVMYTSAIPCAFNARPRTHTPYTPQTPRSSKPPGDRSKLIV